MNNPPPAGGGIQNLVLFLSSHRQQLCGGETMNTTFAINDSFIAEQNRKAKDWLDDDYEHLGRQLRRRGVEIENLTAQAQSFKVAVPSWGVGTGGTRFARFPGPGEPRGVYDKLEDCAT